MGSARWAFDDARFEAEVLRPVSRGWNPSDNMFRCCLLPIDVDDQNVVEAALDGVLVGINKYLIRGHYMTAAKVLKKRHGDVREVLGNTASRRRHRDQVKTARQTLRGVLEGEVRDYPWVPSVLVSSLEDRFAGEFTHREIVEVLGEVGRTLREPAALPDPAEPPRGFGEVRAELGLLDQQSLRAYLMDRFSTLTPDTAKVDTRRAALRLTASGEALTAEQKLLERLRKWLRTGQLMDVLRGEMRVDLTRALTRGYGEVRSYGASEPVAGALRVLRFPPSPDELAYAVLVASRFGGGAGPSWRTAVEQALAARNPRAALALLEAQPQLRPADEQQRDRLRTQIEDIDKRLSRARDLESGDPEAALSEYQQIASFSDEQEFEQALQRCRPAAPSGVRASVTAGQGRVVVAWSPSTARVGDITYRVLRGVGAAPSLAAGVPVGGDVSDTELADTDPPAGARVFYSVFTLRNGRPADVAATTSTAIVVTPDVSGLTLRGDEQAVEGTWRLPAGAVGAQVTRSTAGGAPRRVAGGPTGFRDDGPAPDVAYMYRVRAEYRTADGAVLLSDGVEATGGTRARPQPVREFVAGLEGSELTVSWQPPARGSVEVRLFERRPEVREGDIVSALSVQRTGSGLTLDGAAGVGELRAVLPSAGRQYWLVPFTVLDDLAIAGRPHRLDSRLPPVRGLTARRLGGDVVRLTWHWPGQAPEVLVGWKPGGAPTSPRDAEATFRRFTKSSYLQDGADVSLPFGEHTFLVCATAYLGGRQVYGPETVVREGVRRRARYDVRRVGRRFAGRGSGRTFCLVVESLDGTAPPAVQLVARASMAPLDAADGEPVVTTRPADDGDAVVTTEFDLDRFRGGRRPLILRAFPADGSIGSVELVPANPRNLEIR